MLQLPDDWVWDMWFADDGELFHLFFLHAPRSLQDPELRHSNARIGHAVSEDLHIWTRRPDALHPGSDGDPDATATWTGSVIRGDDGIWRLYYTGTTYFDQHNVQVVCMATSPDLNAWTKQGEVLRADPRWYETYGSSEWHEECWRDPWVCKGEDGRWHMYITARNRDGDLSKRGTIGHATSSDLSTWQPTAPVSPPSHFAQVEVVQRALIGGKHVTIFSCLREHANQVDTPTALNGEIWAVVADIDTDALDLSTAEPVTAKGLYCGRLVQDRTGAWQLFAFALHTRDGFGGHIQGPLPVTVVDGHLQVEGHRIPPDSSPL